MEKYQEVERSIIKTYRSKIWAKFVNALKEYELIKPNDKICVCISGGKDSFLLAKCFQELARHSDFPFSLEFLVMDPGYNPKNREMIIENAKLLNIPITIRESKIFNIVTNVDKNPCYLCARMRRGFLYENARSLGCNKIALGHHFDDVIETIMMGILYNGQYKTMLPKAKSENFSGMELIRPLYQIKEQDILNWASFNDLKFLQCACRFTEESQTYQDGSSDSKRKEMKLLIQDLKKKHSIVDQNIFMSSYNIILNQVIGYKTNDEKHTFLETYDNED